MPESKPEKTDKPKISRRKVIKWSIGSLASISLIEGFFLEPHRVRLQHTRVPINGLGDGFAGYRVAVISDFHIPHWVSETYVQHAIGLALAEKPDIILLPGDFCNSHGSFGMKGNIPVPDLASYLSSLAAPDGVYGVLGNHDYWLDADGVLDSLSRTPVNILRNENLILRRGSDSLAIVGTPDLWEDDIDLSAAFGGISQETPRILMQHNPDLCEEFPEGYRVDLQVSGHTHGGQVRIPFGPALLLPTKYGNKYREGLVHGPRHRVYVTRGVGMSSTLPVRFCCPPEVTLLELVQA
jgi:predicted MPP superfamily phosphohydrolase